MSCGAEIRVVEYESNWISVARCYFIATIMGHPITRPFVLDLPTKKRWPLTQVEALRQHMAFNATFMHYDGWSVAASFC